MPAFTIYNAFTGIQPCTHGFAYTRSNSGFSIARTGALGDLIFCRLKCAISSARSTYR